MESNLLGAEVDPVTGHLKVPRFKEATIQEIFRLAWTNERRVSESVATMMEKTPKINEIALRLSTEYLRLFTIEVIHRASRIAQLEQEQHSSPSHLLSSDDPHPKQTHHQHGDRADGEANEGEEDPSSSHLGGLIEVRHLQRVAPSVLLDF